MALHVRINGYGCLFHGLADMRDLVSNFSLFYSIHSARPTPSSAALVVVVIRVSVPSRGTALLTFNSYGFVGTTHIDEPTLRVSYCFVLCLLA